MISALFVLVGDLRGMEGMSYYADTMEGRCKRILDNKLK